MSQNPHPSDPSGFPEPAPDADAAERAWDFIVVGAGSAGAVVAARLAEAGRRILLLEAGPAWRSAELPSAWRDRSPGRGLYRPGFEDSVWPNLFATRTPKQGEQVYFRGRGLGGSSTVNSFIAVRPTEDDFAEWTAAGCAGWTFDDALPFFNRSESDLQFGTEPYHGSDGPTPVDRFPLGQWGAVDTALRAAAIEHGFGWSDDINAPGATGASPLPMHARGGVRVTTNDGYLEPLREHPGLTIRGDVLVDQVTFDGDQANGVRLANGELLFASHVVLSAGVVGSPAILMRSGIGPAEVLEPLGITIRQEAPVGRFLSDHVTAKVTIPLAPQYQMPPGDRHTNCAVRYSSGLDGLRNDMMIWSVNRGALLITPDGVNGTAGALWIWVNRAFSTGTLAITSTDPAVMPRVEHNLLSDERDRRRLRDGTRAVARLVDSAHFTSMCEGDLWDANRELRAALDRSDDDLDDWLFLNACDTAHACSTCRMGPSGDPAAITDPQGAVHGIAGLSVIDASILPHSPRANTHLVTVMLGEMLAARLAAR